MKLETLYYTKDKGWSKPFPQWDSEKTLVLAFCAPEFYDNPLPIQELAKAYPKSTVTGCSSAGEIFGTAIMDNSLSVAIIQFDSSEIKIVFSTVSNSDTSLVAGENIAKGLLGEKLKAIFILSDGLKVNGSELVKGVNGVIPKQVVVTGGLSGDGDKFKRTWVIRNGKPELNLICAIGLYGEKLKIGHGSKGGWDVFGPERRVTRSKANVLYELDGQPALSLYKQYLGDRASGLPATGLLFPLMIRKDEEDEKQIVRTILAVNEEDQSMTFAGDIPTGYLAKLMRANFDRLVMGANEAAIAAGSVAFNKLPILAIAISCVGRRLLLGERTEEETESTLESLPKDTQQVGFYSYGELSPFASGSCELHNQTMTLTTIGEE